MDVLSHRLRHEGISRIIYYQTLLLTRTIIISDGYDVIIIIISISSYLFFPSLSARFQAQLKEALAVMFVLTLPMFFLAVPSAVASHSALTTTIKPMHSRFFAKSTISVFVDSQAFISKEGIK